MKEKEVSIGDRKFVVKELLAIEFDEIQENESSKERLKEIVVKSINISNEDYDKLTLKERSKILENINEVNGWTDDFQNTQESEEVNTKMN